MGGVLVRRPVFTLWITAAGRWQYMWTIYLIDELPVPVTPPHHSAALRVEDDRVRGREKIHRAQHREAEPQPTAAAAAGVNVLN